MTDNILTNDRFPYRWLRRKIGRREYNCLLPWELRHQRRNVNVPPAAGFLDLVRAYNSGWLEPARPHSSLRAPGRQEIASA